MNAFKIVWFAVLVLFYTANNITFAQVQRVKIMGPTEVHLNEVAEYKVVLKDENGNTVGFPQSVNDWDWQIFEGSTHYDQPSSIAPASCTVNWAEIGEYEIEYVLWTNNDPVFGDYQTIVRLMVTVLETYPEPLISVGNSGVIENGSNLSLSVNNYNYDSYQWLASSGNPISGATGATYNTAQPGTYKVRVTKGGKTFTSEPKTLISATEAVNRNYVRANKIQVAGITSTSVSSLPVTSNLKTTRYFDGLGRPVQTVTEKGSPNTRDMVNPIAYDMAGRQVREYLPYTEGSNGYYKIGAITDPGSSSSTEKKKYRAGDQHRFYQQEQNVAHDRFPFTHRVYDNSPLNRIKEQGAPGEHWQPNSTLKVDRPSYINSSYPIITNGGATVKTSYLTNQANEVLLWKYIESSNGAYGGISAAQTSGAARYYSANALQVTQMMDENQLSVYEYKDKTGKVVLKRNQQSHTYYVYDDFGNLVTVIQPEGVKYLEDNNIRTPDADFLSKWCFLYVYDARHRLIGKKVPGAEWVYMVYDKRDRVVLVQDGNQRGEPEVVTSDIIVSQYEGKSYKLGSGGSVTLSPGFQFTASENSSFFVSPSDLSAPGKWTFTKYDALNRPVMTGEVEIDEDRSTLQGMLDAETVFYEGFIGNSASGNIQGYSNNSFPRNITQANIHAITYYDNYNFTTKTFSLPSGIFDTSDGKILPAAFSSVKGQMTGTKVKVLGSTSDYVETVNFYDDRYRLIQSKVLNYKDGNDVLTTQYDFAGRVRKTYLEHQNPSADITGTDITQEYTYDHAGRLLTVNHSINGATPVTLLSNTYNELGELVNKDLANGFEDIDYAYNIRGWLSKINDPVDATTKLFEMGLKYDDAPIAQFNGNIGATVWKNPYESIINQYDYTYDGMNRLTSALYDDGGASTMDFDVPLINYDLNGNIKTLQRKGNDENDNPNVTIDNLSYTYAKGNQLSKVTDASGMDTGFKDGTNETTEYTYDANGNMILDKNKGITSIEYNFLNLPRKVIFSASKYIEYTYDASGAKLSQKTVDGGTTKVSDYLGGFVYENNELQFLQHDEGRVVAKRNETGVFDGFEYQYHLKDHLGNVRATFKTEQETDNYLATLENDAATKSYESTYFSRYGEVTRINADIFDHTDAGTSKTYSMRLNGAGNEIYGLAKSLEVKPGDVVEAEVWAKYLDPSTTGTPGSSFAQLIEDLANNAPSVVIDGATAGTDPMPYAGLIGYGGDVSSGPKAYLNMIVFDLNWQVVNAAYTPVTAAAEEDGTVVAHEYLNIAPITIEKPGYVYIYLSNENSTPVEVFFDDFKVTHTNSPIVQKDDYYPFGMSFNSYSRVSDIPQKFKFNGKEIQQKTDWYHYGARFYMPDLGKWSVIDPATEISRNISPYTYSFNNPVRFIDYDGMVPTEGVAIDPTELFGQKIDMSSAPGRTNAAGHPRNGPWFWRKMLEQHPEMFSKENVASIRRNRSPVVDGKWVEYNPTHADYKGGKLIHHHIDQGKMATGIPETAHRKYFKNLHVNRGGMMNRLNKLGGALSVVGFLTDIFNNDPLSFGMLYSAGAKENTLYFDTDSEQYFKITERKDITGDGGEVIGQEVTYEVYSDYTYDENAGKYEGAGEKKTYTGRTFKSIDEAHEYLKL